MKKPLLLTLVAVGCVSAADPYTLDSAIIDSNGTKTNAWEALAEQSYYAQVKVPGISTVGHLSFSTSQTFELNLSDMVASQNLEGQSLTLTSFSLLAKNNNTDRNYGTVTIAVNGGQSVSSSNFTIATLGNANGAPPVTWSFDNPLTFTTQDTLTVTISGSGSYGVQAFTPDTDSGYTFGGAPALYDNWATVYRLEAVQSVPEPATATLSLLALAGLAARRRRARRVS